MGVNIERKCGSCFEPFTASEDGTKCIINNVKKEEEPVDISQYNRYVRCELLKLDLPECTHCQEGFYLSNKTGEYQCHRLF